MRYDAIFFDLDGTVIDSLQDIADAVNHTMRRFGLKEWPAEALKPHLGWGVGTLMKRILPEASDERREEILSFYKPYYALHAGDRSRPFEGIVPMLERLRADGLTLAILSNKPDAAVQPLARTWFPGLMDWVAGETEGVRRKPEPDMLQRAADALGVELARCLYVGDSEVDIDTARNARIDCVCVSWGFRSRDQLREAGARVIIDDPRELVEIVERG